MNSLRKQALANSGSLRPLYEDEDLGQADLPIISPREQESSLATPRPLRIPPRLRNLEPISWQDSGSFTEQLKISSKRCSGLIYNVLAHRVVEDSESSIQPMYFCFAHGAGSSALSFATLVKHLKDACAENKTPAGFLAMDYRGHGETSSTGASKKDEDYSLATMCDDFTECMTAALEGVLGAQPVSCILVGHSLGGAIVTTVAQTGSLPYCTAFVVLDVVEGTALDALHSTSQILKQRPASFTDMSEAIGWALSSKTISNQISARTSIPALLRSLPESDRLLWRHDWKPTQGYWQAWFQDLSSKFLSASRSLGKLLILAGTDRLDKPLMIAQMQGAFQMNVIPGAGHFVHEDEPFKVALIIAAFADRFGKSV